MVDNRRLVNSQDIFPKKTPSYGKLYASLSIPSAMNTFSITTSIMKDWFLEKFDKEYFKAINIDESHAFKAFKDASITAKLKTSKPSLQIIPRMNFDYNREMIDLHYGGLNNYVITDAVNRSFFQDREKNMYLVLDLDQAEMNFTFRVRVKSRAEQIDIGKYMKMAFGIGTTQNRYVDIDFHVPYQCMLNIAKDAGFTIEDNKIQDIAEFLSYMNRYSSCPFLYKFQTLTGQKDFFIRIPNMYMHINCKDDLDLDDGEVEGQLKSNYIIEMQVLVHIGMPKLYAYMSHNKYQNIIETENVDGIVLYDIKLPTIPDTNSKGWIRYLETEVYEENIDKPLRIEFAELFEGSKIGKLIEYNNKAFITSSIFIDMKLYNDGEEVQYTINWTKQVLETRYPLNHLTSYLVIYVDLEYVNNQIINMEKLYSDRVRNNK